MRYMKETDALLPVWFEHSAISGYGDMQSLETKVDSEVRHAREIPASEFEVQPKLLEKIQDVWGEFLIRCEHSHTKFIFTGLEVILNHIVTLWKPTLLGHS